MIFRHFRNCATHGILFAFFILGSGCRPSHSADRYATLMVLLTNYANSTRYPCTSVRTLSTTAQSIQFLPTSASTQMAFATGGAVAGQHLILNSTSTALSPAPGIPAAIIGSTCAVAGGASVPSALGSCTNTSTNLTCTINTGNTYLFRIEFALAATPTDITATLQ